jgi:hypothetical protein
MAATAAAMTATAAAMTATAAAPGHCLRRHQGQRRRRHRGHQEPTADP